MGALHASPNTLDQPWVGGVPRLWQASRRIWAWLPKKARRARSEGQWRTYALRIMLVPMVIATYLMASSVTIGSSQNAPTNQNALPDGSFEHSRLLGQALPDYSPNASSEHARALNC